MKERTWIFCKFLKRLNTLKTVRGRFRRYATAEAAKLQRDRAGLKVYIGIDYNENNLIFCCVFDVIYFCVSTYLRTSQFTRI